MFNLKKLFYLYVLKMIGKKYGTGSVLCDIIKDLESGEKEDTGGIKNG